MLSRVANRAGIRAYSQLGDRVSREVSPHAAFYIQFGKPLLKVSACSIGTFLALKYTKQFMEPAESTTA